MIAPQPAMKSLACPLQVHWQAAGQARLIEACWASTPGLVLLAFEDPATGVAALHISSPPQLEAQLLPLSLPGLEGAPLLHVVLALPSRLSGCCVSGGIA